MTINTEIDRHGVLLIRPQAVDRRPYVAQHDCPQWRSHGGSVRLYPSTDAYYQCEGCSQAWHASHFQENDDASKAMDFELATFIRDLPIILNAPGLADAINAFIPPDEL